MCTRRTDRSDRSRCAVDHLHPNRPFWGGCAGSVWCACPARESCPRPYRLYMLPPGNISYHILTADHLDQESICPGMSKSCCGNRLSARRVEVWERGRRVKQACDSRRMLGPILRVVRDGLVSPRILPNSSVLISPTIMVIYFFVSPSRSSSRYGSWRCFAETNCVRLPWIPI